MEQPLWTDIQEHNAGTWKYGNGVPVQDFVFGENEKPTSGQKATYNRVTKSISGSDPDSKHHFICERGNVINVINAINLD